MKILAKYILSAAALLAASCSPHYSDAPIRSMEVWPDQDGVHINAHGGGILFHGNTFYWFGEFKSEDSNDALVGVTCYSSKDLVNWKNEGIALSVQDDPASEITRGCIMERPKVLYNKATGKFVMWFHLELKGHGYTAARAGVAVSDNVTGPYTYLHSERVNPGIYPANMTQEEIDEMNALNPEDYPRRSPQFMDGIKKGLYFKNDFQEGQMARDQTLYLDDNGKAYHIFSSEDNFTLHIAELSDDFTTHSGRYARVIPGGNNEAPAIFKKDGKYWMITSGCTGWAPNAARMFSATDIFGPWTQYPNPCTGEDAELTYHGQSTFILPVPGKKDAFLFMADNWRPDHPIDGRYIWLPVQFREDGTPFLEFIPEWNIKDQWKQTFENTTFEKIVYLYRTITLKTMAEETKNPMDLNGDGKVTVGEKVQYYAGKAGEKAKKDAKILADKAAVKAKELGTKAEIKAKDLGEKAKVKAKEIGAQAKVKAKEVSEKAAVKAKDLGEKAKVKAKEVYAEAKVEAKELSDKAKAKINEYKAKKEA